MAARDDANRWQTGVKTIQLVADSERGRLIASENYAPCSEPREKRVEATYTVPANPPPIMRLTALVEDHAGLMDTDVGLFPTGDWYGTIKSHLKGNIYNDTAEIEFVISVASDGTLTGRGRARVTMEPFTDGPWPCTYSHTISPSEFDVEVGVQRSFLGDEFEIKPSTAGSATLVCTRPRHAERNRGLASDALQRAGTHSASRCSVSLLAPSCARTRRPPDAPRLCL